MRLKNNVAVITGAGSGMGKATAGPFAARRRALPSCPEGNTRVKEGEQHE
jgi:NAD(P)-dependent dehydrogenase (short-subunit alcohol dehydrogenase family)